MNWKPLLLVALLISLGDAALAQTATTVLTVPVGNWLTNALGVLEPALVMLLAAVATWALAKLPAAVSALIGPLLTEQILKRATDFALNAVAGAAKDKTVSVDVGNAVVQAALDYVVKHAPDWAAQFDAATIMQKIIARLNLAPNAKVGASGTNIVAAPAPVLGSAGPGILGSVATGGGVAQ